MLQSFWSCLKGSAARSVHIKHALREEDKPSASRKKLPPTYDRQQLLFLCSS